jgi:hypothetical protein
VAAFDLLQIGRKAKNMSKPHTYLGDLSHLPKALHRLLSQCRFVVWRWKKRSKPDSSVVWTKPPYRCADPRQPAKSNDPSTWGTYQEAVAAVAAKQADGIGIMLKDSELGAADLDHVRDPMTGILLDWARQLCDEAMHYGVYQEVTVSGCGLRFLGLTQGGEIHRKFFFDQQTGAGLELYRDCYRYITLSGLQEGRCDELASIDELLDLLLLRYGAPVSQKATKGLDFNTAGLQFDYLSIIQNGVPEGQRSEAFQAVVWYLAGQGWSPERILEELAKHPHGIGAKYANRLAREVDRSFEKWAAQRRASAIGIAAGPTAAGATTAQSSASWPQIIIRPGELPRVVNEAESALLQLGREIYQRGGLMVRPVLNKLKASDNRDMVGWQLAPVTLPYLAEAFTCAAQFLRFDHRSKKFAAVDAPKRVAETYLARQGVWRLPILTGITNTPFLRPDGSLCEQQGYDQSTGLLFKPDGQTFPAIAPAPTKAGATAALAKLDSLLKGFPFVGPADRAVALSAILTMLDRRAMATAPLHAFTAPTAGTGKSLLVDVAAVLATGRPMPVISQGKNEEELEKRLASALLAGDAGISIDNCEYTLQGGFLCQALTQPMLNIRLLGYSRKVPTPVNAALYATGNNLEIAGDLIRRCLLCSMDAGLERPELRLFSENVIEQTQLKRGELVGAALTMLRAWHIAGAKAGLTSLGGFEEWSYRIRDALVWLGCTIPVRPWGRFAAAIRSGRPW